MQLECPKCAFHLTLAAGNDGQPRNLEAVHCSECGTIFDARPIIYPAAPRETPGNKPSPPAEPISPDKAAAELREQSMRFSERRARQLPKKIGAYEVIAEINRGGMGLVYKAVDPQLRRLVAIKVLLAGEGAKDEDIKRFQREAQATARLLHPNIVPIYAVGEHEGKPYLVMDFVEGKTAKQLKEQGKMTPRLALSIIEGAAEALHHAHLHGVIHRDVKPGNIIVDKSERAQLMDFGLARRVDEDLEVTQSGTTMGTPSYMSPEQAEGKLDLVDAQSDVYSAGACLYELLTGHPPFEATTIMATLRKVLEHNPVPPRRRNPKIHRDVETICLKCLEKEKRNRYSSAKQLAEDIRRFNAGEAITAKPLGFFAARFRAAKQHKEITLAIVMVVASLLAALGYTLNEARNVRNKAIVERQRTLEKSVSEGAALLARAKEDFNDLKHAAPADFQARAARARALIVEAGSHFRKAESIAPDDADARAALDALRKLDNAVEVQRFIFKARAFLNPPQGRPDDPPVQPNYAGAEFAAQEAVDRDPENTEARELLRLAIGFRTVSVDTDGAPAEVFIKRVMDALGRQLPADNGDGKALGMTPVRKEFEPGMYIVSLYRAGNSRQQVTLNVKRDSSDADLTVRLVLNSPHENMILIPEGNVSLPQIGEARVPAYYIDRYEYPNKAGGIPLTQVETMVEARDLCKRLGKNLCTSAQWLRACMGDEERRYPYGKSYVSGMCAMGFDGASQKTPIPSGYFQQCHTPEGVYDMSGNVAEWTDSDQQEVVFGGEWTSPARFADLTVSCRARSLHEEVNKERLGVRCCKNK